MEEIKGEERRGEEILFCSVYYFVLFCERESGEWMTKKVLKIETGKILN